MEKLVKLIWTEDLLSLVSGKTVLGSEVLLTSTVVKYLEKKLPGEKDIWELVVDKARAYVESEVTDGEIFKQPWAQAEQKL